MDQFFKQHYLHKRDSIKQTYKDTVIIINNFKGMKYCATRYINFLLNNKINKKLIE